MVKSISLMTALFVASTCLPVQAQGSASAPLARELTALLDRHQLDSIAARMPGEPDGFVAALYHANSQLFVISTRYAAPSLLREQIWNRHYRDVYSALHGAGERQGRFFVLDLGADGFAPMNEQDAHVDVLYEDGVKQTTFNGNWDSQNLSKAEYQRQLAAADARYAKMLDVLIKQLKAGT